MAERSKSAHQRKPEKALQVQKRAGDSKADAVARLLLEPDLRHAVAAMAFSEAALGYNAKDVGLVEQFQHIKDSADKAAKGDLAFCSRLLAAQAITLDSMFAEMARRSAANMGEYLDASERYGRLALKAQANCRATLEALAKLHQPREQTVRHVHVNEGGQAIVADQFHNHEGGGKNGKTVKQCHATGTADPRAALPSPDPHWHGMPVAGSERQTAMQDARRDKPRRA